MTVAELKIECRKRMEFKIDAVAMFILKWIAPVLFIL